MTLCARSLLDSFFKRGEVGGYIPFSHHLWPSQFFLVGCLIVVWSTAIWWVHE